MFICCLFVALCCFECDCFWVWYWLVGFIRVLMLICVADCLFGVWGLVCFGLFNITWLLGCGVI